MTQPTSIVRLGDRLDAPAPTDDGPLPVQQLATPVVGPADRIAGPDAGVDLTNVIAFTPLRRDGPANDLAQEPILAKLVLDDTDRLTTVVGNNDTRPWIAGLLLCSGLIHAGILAALNREPQPMASIGIEVISVELVFGTDSAAGPAARADDAQSTAPATTPPEQRPVEPAATQEAAVQPQEDKPEPPPETMTANPVPPPPEIKTEPEPVTARQEAALPPPEPAPVQVAPAPPPTAVAPPPPVKKPVEQAPPPRPTKPVARPAPSDQKHPRQPRTDGRLAAREPATTPGGVSPGRSDSVSNYRGIVFAHLSRQQHAPTGVLRAGERRTGTVSFTIDGNGRATGIVLMRSTGVASLDGEAQAMVRRASPFPPPPGGRPIPFTAPVAFSVR